MFESVLKNKPNKHVDVGSTYQMSGYLSKIVPTTFIDIRPIDADLKNLKVLDASILSLPFEDGSQFSLSSLHVIEHIGLGRYGDPVDPDGWKEACAELQRVLAPLGKLYVSMPIGKARLCFNAHRIVRPLDVLQSFCDLELSGFSAVDDNGAYIQDADINDYSEAVYSLGLFTFSKKVRVQRTEK